MKDIVIVVEGPTGRDVKKIELDGHDITSMCKYIQFEASGHDVSVIRLGLVGNVMLTIQHPFGPIEAKNE